MKKLLDLRFVIGVFFAVVGSLLVIYHFVGSPAATSSSGINSWCGAVFLLFGSSMILLSYVQKMDND